MMRIRAFALAAVLTVCVTASAAEDGDADVNVVPPPPPEALTRGEPIEPSVTIVSRPWAQIREYSVHGQVYAVHIDPGWGPPYFLYDANGDGSFESRYPDNLDAPDIHQWELLRW